MEDERFQLGATVGASDTCHDVEEGLECTSSPFRSHCEPYQDSVPSPEASTQGLTYATHDDSTLVSELTYTEHGTVDTSTVHTPAIAIAPENVSIVEHLPADEPLVKNLQQVVMT